MVVEGIGAWDVGGVGDDVGARVEGERVGGNYLATVNNRLWMNTWADIDRYKCQGCSIETSDPLFLFSNFRNE